MTDLKFTRGVFTLTHTDKPWRMVVNRHPETNGGAWGWIEGPYGNVTWSSRTRNDAAAAVLTHNNWLDAQKSPMVRLAGLEQERVNLVKQIKPLEVQLKRLRGNMTAVALAMNTIRVDELGGE